MGLSVRRGGQTRQSTYGPELLTWMTLSARLAVLRLLQVALSSTGSHAAAAGTRAAAPGRWCPQFHTISNHYDPSGPLFDDASGLWHLFPDGCAPDGNSNARGNWCHYTSPDLIQWTAQDPLGPHWVGNGDTGSVSVTQEGGVAIALFPALVVGQHQKFQSVFCARPLLVDRSGRT